MIEYCQVQMATFAQRLLDFREAQLNEHKKHFAEIIDKINWETFLNSKEELLKDEIRQYPNKKVFSLIAPWGDRDLFSPRIEDGWVSERIANKLKPYGLVKVNFDGFVIKFELYSDKKKA